MIYILILSLLRPGPSLETPPELPEEPDGPEAPVLPVLLPVPVESVVPERKLPSTISQARLLS